MGKKLPDTDQIDGNGENRKGPITIIDPYAPWAGDGSNKMSAARPEGTPATFCGVTPPIGWTDSGIPGLFANQQPAFYQLKPLQVQEVELKFRLAFPIGDGDMEIVEVAKKLRFNQKLLKPKIKVDGVKYLCMDTIISAKVVYVQCHSGDGNIYLNGDLPIPISSGSFRKEGNGSFAFFNYKGINSVYLSGDMTVDVALFQ
jgi:hypothetical protein